MYLRTRRSASSRAPQCLCARALPRRSSGPSRPVPTGWERDKRVTTRAWSLCVRVRRPNHTLHIACNAEDHQGQQRLTVQERVRGRGRVCFELPRAHQEGGQVARAAEGACARAHRALSAPRPPRARAASRRPPRARRAPAQTLLVKYADEVFGETYTKKEHTAKELLTSVGRLAWGKKVAHQFSLDGDSATWGSEFAITDTSD